MNRPLWADIHNHNGVGYGRGEPERSYEIARGVLLDAYCFTPHGLWHDLPAGDRRMVDFHAEGFERVRSSWERVRTLAEARNAPGEFVSLLGFEWHSSRHGDYHVIFPGGEGEICAAGSLAELQAFVRERGALMIPHHLAYNSGWRGLDWEGLDAGLSPVVCVFSEHGCSAESEFGAPMTLHSMGGSERSQTYLERLKRGLLAGAVASTDNHWGHPGSYGEGLAGIWAGELSRAGVLDALRRRHTYAVTGDRIFLQVRMADGVMGDLLDSGCDRTLRCSVRSLGEIDYVRVIKNGRAAHSLLPPESREGDSVHTVRVDFGWGAMESREVTDWLVSARVEGGRIAGVFPCFAGGGGSIEKVNRVTETGDDSVRFEAYTSRANSRAQSGLVLRLEADASARVEVDAEALWNGSRCGCRLGAALGQLRSRDEWAAISEVFSAPRMRLGHCHGASETDVEFEWIDPRPGENDWYMLKVLQKNGQAAWSSPIWCRGS